KLLEIRGRVAGNEELCLIAMARKRNISRRCPPVLRMIEIGLIERTALSFIDGPGIAETKVTKIPHIELNQTLKAAIEPYGVDAAVNCFHRARLAVVKAKRLVSIRKLYPVVGGKGCMPVCGIDVVFFSSELSRFLTHTTEVQVELVNVAISV